MPRPDCTKPFFRMKHINMWEIIKQNAGDCQRGDNGDSGDCQW